MRLLVTGGAGYIGSVTVEALRARGDHVHVLDNLATGHRAAVDPAVPFHHADLRDTAAVARVLSDHAIEGVLHFAASSIVPQSVADPAATFENNVGGTLSLLRAMIDTAAPPPWLVFSSTAAVYGEPRDVPIPDDHPIAPTNPYGHTKAMMEEAMRCYGAATGLRHVALRYFNACGATATRGEHHDPETHLIPLVLQVAAGRRAHVTIFGDDYPTPDGTCVRDYIHVADLAAAHVAAVDHLAAGGAATACNLGNGRGYSVREVVEACRRVTGQAIPVTMAARRPGDPSRLVADATRARDLLGWTPARPDLDTIVADAWRWHAAHPDGYGTA